MRTFYTEHGKIVFDSNRILIEDNAKKEKYTQIFLGSMGFLLGLSMIYKSFTEGFISELGLVLCFLHASMIILYLIRDFSNDIPFSKIQSIRVKNRLGNVYLKIKLTNNRARYVRGAFTKEKLENFLAEEFQKNSLSPTKV